MQQVGDLISLKAMLKNNTPPRTEYPIGDDEEARLASKKALEEHDKRAKVAGILKAAAIPPRFVNRTFENYHADGVQQKALDTSKRYAENFPECLEAGRSLMFVGKPGTGKTHLAIAIANAIMQQGYTALFTSVIQATRRVKECYRAGASKTESEVITSFSVPDLLILDEVGVQFGTDTERMIIFEIINCRYENLKPTILISNEDESGLKTYIGERVFDRMLENKGGVLVFDWGSYRRSAS
jgi:DNA replication protein DnaC